MADAEEALDYSIVIPAYNEEKLLPATLAAVKTAMDAEPDRHGEIVVTDNNSTDATAEIARAAGARVVFEAHNQIARARNAGGEVARGQALIFLDADTILPPALLSAALAAMDRPDICGAGTIVEMDDELDKGGKRLVALWHFLARRFKWACGAFVLCRREAFMALGGFDEKLYASEEINFSRRLQKWGKRHGQKMIILDVPIITSARKLQWYSHRELLRQIMPLMWPWSLRKREKCGLWYRRPEDE